MARHPRGQALMRATYHVAMLILLGVMTLSGVGARWQPDPTPPVLAAAATSVPLPTPSTVISSLTNQPALTNQIPPASSGPSTSAPAPAAAPPTSVAAAPGVPAPPGMPAARWVQNFKATELFDGPGTGAASLGMAPQFRTFRVVEQVEDGRSHLFDPGNGEGRLPGDVWANLNDFG